MIATVTKQSERGFSILEVLITAGIIVIITGTITLKYGSFNNLILLKNQAYQAALDLRYAQSRALSSQGGYGSFRYGYGVHFDLDTPDRYVLFIDSNGNGSFEPGELLEVRRLDSRFVIHQLCAGTTSATCNRTKISVVFKRPNFDAVMRDQSGAILTTGRVLLRSLQNNIITRGVVINAAGQIYVQ